MELGKGFICCFSCVKDVFVKAVVSGMIKAAPHSFQL